MATRFDRVGTLTSDGCAALVELTKAAETLAQTLERTVSLCRERSLALTHLETAMLYATRAVEQTRGYYKTESV